MKNNVDVILEKIDIQINSIFEKYEKPVSKLEKKEKLRTSAESLHDEIHSIIFKLQDKMSQSKLSYKDTEPLRNLIYQLMKKVLC